MVTIVRARRSQNFRVVAKGREMRHKDLLEIIKRADRENLTKLDLSGKYLTSIPPELGRLLSLTRLYLHSNQLINVPSELGQLTNLTTLHLDRNQLTSVPAELAHLTNLTLLHLDRNQLTNIPAELAQLTNLTSLSLGGNRLSSVPAELAQLTNLTHLYLGNNQLTSVPSELGQLINLTHLYLHNNQLKSVPAELGQLTNLKELYLYNNQLTSIPSELGRLKKLRVLDLRTNKLTELPPEIDDIGIELKWKITGLGPSGIFTLDNPLENPPKEIFEHGTKAIKQWFKALKEEGQRRLNEVKVLLVGYGGAGKTSIVRKLRTGKFNVKEVKTHGVKISKWKIKDSDEQITVHFWDYGGQGIMQATHRVFFSHRSLYLLVIDARQESVAEEWLKNIESLGGQSPVLVVINKIDEHVFGLNEPALQRKYPNIKGFYHVSCKTGDGINLFRRDLRKHICQVEMIKTNWPRRWANVKERIGRLRRDYIAYSEYQSICIKEGVVKEERQRELIAILHELGVMLHFPDRHLQDMEVMNPEWVTGGIYKIINSNDAKQCRGKVPRKRLAHILNDKRFWDQDKGLTRKPRKYSAKEQTYVVDLMNKFELCFEFDGHTILVPDLLTEKEPTEGLPEATDLRFYFEYDFMPPVVMPRFMVKNCADLDPNLCWRTGAVLRNDSFDSVAVVRQDKHEKRIYVGVSGRQARDYFATIRKTIQDINNSFKKLDVTEWVPLPDEQGHAVKYIDLIGHEVCKRREKFVGELEKGYSVAELLGAIESPEETRERIIFAEEYFEKGDKMKIDKMNISGRQVVVADRLGNVDYHESMGISESKLDEFKEAVKALPQDIMAALNSQYDEFVNADTEEKKKTTVEKIKNFLIKNGVEVARSLTVEALKMILMPSQ